MCQLPCTGTFQIKVLKNKTFLISSQMQGYVPDFQQGVTIASGCNIKPEASMPLPLLSG